MAKKTVTCTPDDLADLLNKLSDDVRAGDDDAAKADLNDIINSMLDGCCQGGKTKTALASHTKEVDALKKFAADLKASPKKAIDWSKLWALLGPILAILFGGLTPAPVTP